MPSFVSETNNLDHSCSEDGISIKEKLNQLAIDLATNHCTVSFGEDEKKTVKLSEIFDTGSPLYDQLRSQLKNKSRENEQHVSDILQHRNILIIGAGATYDSYKCIPLGVQVIEKFEEKYRGKIEAFPAVMEKFKNHLNELRLQNREPDFENMLSLYSELILTPDELRSEISDLFNFKYAPSLFYEIIAHLFKHSFFDVIINFNFDEILDQAIEEELGKDNYYHILSDGDCVPIEDMMVDGRLKIPIYIKPHGTVSHKSTLRFTKRHYLDVPEKIKDLLIKLISGERGEVIGKKNEEVGNMQKVNIIAAGFNMESLEFGDILNEYLPEQSKIYHICYGIKDKRRDPYFVNKVFPKFFKRAFHYHSVKENKSWDEKELHKNIYTRIAVEEFNTDGSCNELSTPFAELFSYLWRTLFHLFRKDLTPRSIGRHEIISYLFYDPCFGKYSNKERSELNRTLLKDRYENCIDYFLDRTIVEIAMSINRNNGIIEIAQLLGDRAGFYYKKYRDCYFAIKKTNKGAYSIYDLINQFVSLERNNDFDTTYSKNIFQLDLQDLDKLMTQDPVLRYLHENPQIEDFDAQDVNKAMRRWIVKELVNNEKGEPEIKTSTKPLLSFLKKFNSILRSKDSEYDPVSIMVLYRLFKVKYLSQTFISNFQNNYDKLVYNSNKYYEKDHQAKRVTLLDELARLFLKSSRRHYYSIRPRYHDPKNYLSESFSKSRILHTNLSVEYAFRNIFLNFDWDIALIISETGSILNFLESREKRDLYSRKKIIVLNSFDAIKQFFKKIEDVDRVNESQNRSYQALLFEDPTKKQETVYTFSLPSIQHNHHMMLFIKKVHNPDQVNKHEIPIYQVKDKNARKAIFSMTGGLYIYRQGFSNNLNPLMVGMLPYNNPDEDISTLQHDFSKLLRIFCTTFCRALAFQGIKKIKNLDVDLGKYQKWQPDEQVENINKLLKYLYDTDHDLFTIEEDSQTNYISTTTLFPPSTSISHNLPISPIPTATVPTVSFPSAAS